MTEPLMCISNDIFCTGLGEVNKRLTLCSLSNFHSYSPVSGLNCLVSTNQLTESTFLAIRSTAAKKVGFFSYPSRIYLSGSVDVRSGDSPRVCIRCTTFTLSLDLFDKAKKRR